jgi:hypothetical protein
MNNALAYVDGAMVSARGWIALAVFIRECLKVLRTEIHHATQASAPFQDSLSFWTPELAIDCRAGAPKGRDKRNLEGLVGSAIA